MSGGNLQPAERGVSDTDQLVCTHLNRILELTPQTSGCEECLAAGDLWVHVRLCVTCGHVGCCNSSRNRHATRHYTETGHPIMRSLQRGESWYWCYVDEVEFELE